MSNNQDAYQQIQEILSKLTEELEKVANRDSTISENEELFLTQVEARIPVIEKDLHHVFEDDNVTEFEKLELYEHLGKLLNDSVKLSKIDDRIDEEEILLITKLKQELSVIITKLKETTDND